jgi:hypothetical protein
MSLLIAWFFQRIFGPAMVQPTAFDLRHALVILLNTQTPNLVYCIVLNGEAHKSDEATS